MASEYWINAQQIEKLRSVKIPDKFFFDFLRGHLDGDGTIKRYNDPVYRNSLRLYISFVSASLSHILWIKQKITKLAGIKGFMRKKCGNGVYDLTFGKKESIVLSKLLYYSADIPHLERKFFRVKDFLEKS